MYRCGLCQIPHPLWRLLSQTALASYRWPSTFGTLQAVNASLYRSESNGDRRAYVYPVTSGYEVNEIA